MCATQNRETLCDWCMHVVSLDEAVSDHLDGFRAKYHPACYDEMVADAEETARQDRQTYEREHLSGNHNER